MMHDTLQTESNGESLPSQKHVAHAQIDIVDCTPLYSTLNVAPAPMNIVERSEANFRVFAIVRLPNIKTVGGSVGSEN